jgi:hypothetical protein
MDERAREKKSVGRGGSSLRKLFLSAEHRGLGSSSPSVADAICVSSWTELFWLLDRWPALQMLGEKRSAFSDCPASLRLECLPV